MEFGRFVTKPEETMPFKPIPVGKPIRIAMLGCGHAARLHSKTLSRHKDVKIWYASRSPDKAKKYNDKYHGAGVFEGYEAAIQSPDIDVVMVLTPPVQHLKLTLDAIKAGKHVIVEKPPFLSSSDFALIREAQDEHKVQVMVAENYFYKPSLKHLQELLGSGIIGDVKFVLINALKMQKTGNWRDDISQAGGGALFEGGIHWVNYLSNLGYHIQTVQGFIPGEQTGMERSVQVVAKFVEGAVGTLLYSWEVDSLFKGLRLSKAYGTKGSITFESNGLFIFVRGKRWKLIFPGIRDISGYRAMFDDFLKALRSGKEPRFNLTLAERDLQIIELINEDVSEDISGY